MEPKINPTTGALESNTGVSAIEFGNDLINPADKIDVGNINGIGEVTSTDFLKTAKLDGLTDLKSAGGFNLGGVGTTIQGIGAVAQAAAGFYDAHNKKKYQDKVFGMEEARVARETTRQDKQQANYDKVFG